MPNSRIQNIKSKEHTAEYVEFIISSKTKLHVYHISGCLLTEKLPRPMLDPDQPEGIHRVQTGQLCPHKSSAAL